MSLTFEVKSYLKGKARIDFTNKKRSSLFFRSVFDAAKKVLKDLESYMEHKLVYIQAGSTKANGR